MWKAAEGSTGQLIRLCAAYFTFYVVYSVAVKLFPGWNQMALMAYTTLGGTAVCLAVVLAAGWYRLASVGRVRVLGLDVPVEYLYIVPSGVCTAVVIPTTTLMYTLPISVMVAMVIMRGSIIVISRGVDAIQIGQGILKKKVYWQENMGVVFAILAVAVQVLYERDERSFDFARSTVAMTILGSYLAAYAIRIYIMNYYKNTRGKGARQDNKGFFGVEQCAAAATIACAAFVVYHSPGWFGWDPAQVRDFGSAIAEPRPGWGWAVLAGTSFGAVAFFSVFLFMFKGRTATFAGLVNRLTSLVAGTTATLITHFAFGGKAPKEADWAALAFILVAVGFLTLAERRRAAELIASHEIEAAPAATAPPTVSPR